MRRPSDHHRAPRARWPIVVAAAAAALILQPMPGVGFDISKPTPDTGTQSSQVVHQATYTVFVRGDRVGFESVTVARTGGGWHITSFGELGPPYRLTNTKFDLTYTSDWQPQRLAIEGAIAGTSLGLTTTFGLTTATVELSRGMQRGSAVHQITARTIVLPEYFFAAFEALTPRLADATVGARFPVYVAPRAETSLTVTAVASKQLAAPSGALQMKQVDIALLKPGSGEQTIELWIDDKQHLARLVVPAEGLTVIREDLATVAVREVRVQHPGDQQVYIPATGFTLAATFTRPPGVGERVPAVVLVGQPGPQDRDETRDGVPVFGLLAGALADAGFAVVRYDKRGTGQSGGRTERATMTTYTDDVLHAITWLRRRNDVDDDRLAVIGYGEGGPLAMLTADREGRIDGVVLLAAPGRVGREIVLEQQQRELAALSISEAEKAQRIALQRRIIDALTAGGSWEQVPADVRAEADTPWFRSWLLFDPAKVMREIDKPVLIVHGGADARMPPAHADALEALALARRRPPTHTRKVIVPNVTHALVEAAPASPTPAGGPETTNAPTLAPGVTSAIVSWLREIWTDR